MAMYYKESADGDNTPVIYVEKLTYSSLKGYILSSFSDVFRTIQYPYLIAVSGSMPNSNIIMRNYYLVQNPNLTFEKLNKSVYSSNSRDQIASNMVWFEKLCDDATKRIDKLYQIQKGSTREQVHELLGKPEQVLPTGIYTEIYYLGNNNRATLQYFSDNITIEIYYEDTKKVVNVIPK